MVAGGERDAPRERLCLGSDGAVTFPGDVLPRSMYESLPEVLNLIKTVLEEKTEAPVDYFWTLESGAIEEYVVFERKLTGKKLLFRVWPFFFPHHKRLECKIYVRDPETCDHILHYLGACATANGAIMVLKD